MLRRVTLLGIFINQFSLFQVFTTSFLETHQVVYTMRLYDTENIVNKEGAQFKASPC